MQFLKRLNFRTKIHLITFVMVVVVLISSGLALDRVVIPAMEQSLGDRAWSLAERVLKLVRERHQSSPRGTVAGLLTDLSQVLPDLEYVQVLQSSGRTLYWAGTARYRPEEIERPAPRSPDGRLSGQLNRSEGLYEVVLSTPEATTEDGPTMVRIGVDAGNLNRLGRLLFKVVLTVALLILAASFFLTRWFTQMITRPVDRLLRMTQFLANGELTAAVNEIREMPPCLETFPEGPTRKEGQPGAGGQSCPFLRQPVGPKSKGLLDRGDLPCDRCQVYLHSETDELSRLLFAFQYMAVQTKRYQEQLRDRYELEDRLLEACPDGIMANDREGRIILYNKGAERLPGYSPAEALGRLSVRDVYQPGEASAIKKALLSDGFGGPGVLIDYATEVVTKDGRRVPIRLSATLLPRERHGTAIVGYFHDLTELNQHINALVEANERLDHANKELASLNRHYLEMLSFVTHELKSPIANGYMSANALRQEVFGVLSPEQTVMVEAVCRNLDQSIEMIRHYLDLSRIEKDELPVQPQPTRILSEVVEPVVKGLASAIGECGMTVVTDVPAELEWSLDPELFRGVMNNLLSNALKYGEDAGTVRISARRSGERCLFEVWNSGPGISEEDQLKLFHKFQRLHAVRQASAKGTGLGLFITKTVVERHGGSIRVESAQGEGVSFLIELP